MNISFEQFEPTGKTVETTQYQLKVILEWMNEHAHVHSEVILFPDILEQIPDDQKKEVLQELMITLVRMKL